MPSFLGLHELTSAHVYRLLALVDELRHLDSSLCLESRFNLFEAISMTRQEIRLSRFLAFLLNPAALHGLGDRFLMPMLMAVTQVVNDLYSRQNINL